MHCSLKSLRFPRTAVSLVTFPIESSQQVPAMTCLIGSLIITDSSFFLLPATVFCFFLPNVAAPHSPTCRCSVNDLSTATRQNVSAFRAGPPRLPLTFDLSAYVLPTVQLSSRVDKTPSSFLKAVCATRDRVAFPCIPNMGRYAYYKPQPSPFPPSAPAGARETSRLTRRYASH